MIFNIVPEISFQSTADDLKEFMNHLKESIDFWTTFVDEEKDRISKVAHKNCLKITDDLYQYLKRKIKGDPKIDEDNFNLIIA